MLFQDFKHQQTEIYNSIKQSKEIFKLEGSKPTIKNKENILIALQYENNFSEKLSKISFEIAEIMHSTKYYPLNIHTTISTHTDLNLLPKLSDIIEKVISQHKYNIQIKFNEVLYNQDSVILAGDSNEDFINIANDIIQEASLNNIELRYPKLSHITLARFAKEITEESVKENLIQLMNSINLLETIKINTITIGTAKTRDNTFSFEKFKLFKLK